MYTIVFIKNKVNLEILPTTCKQRLSVHNPNHPSFRVLPCLSKDTIGVTQYRIYQIGVLLDTVSGGITTYDTAPLATGNTYHFQVTALDAAGNESYSALGAKTDGN
ncbi:hypothetical protein [Paenibacillus sp. 1P07SE]|uniref:hypothetical protein n=1 Tax=Paenibacillus sp. 1P07SE TaxID=3132209 RepID=UPI0039A41775